MNRVALPSWFLSPPNEHFRCRWNFRLGCRLKAIAAWPFKEVMPGFQQVLDDAIRERAASCRTEQRTGPSVHSRRFDPHPYGRSERVHRHIHATPPTSKRARSSVHGANAPVSTAGPRRPACLIALGLAWGCSVAEVNRAFRRRARGAHPDCPGGSHEAMVALSETYRQALAFAR